jgi:hypothetical protein
LGPPFHHQPNRFGLELGAVGAPLIAD